MYVTKEELKQDVLNKTTSVVALVETDANEGTALGAHKETKFELDMSKNPRRPWNKAQHKLFHAAQSIDYEIAKQKEQQLK